MTWRPIFSLTSGPFWSRICSLQRVFFGVTVFFFSHNCTSAAATTPTQDSEDPWAAADLSGNTGDVAALSGVGGCPRWSYNSMLQYDWCTSKGIVPCSLFGPTRWVGQSR